MNKKFIYDYDTSSIIKKTPIVQNALMNSSFFTELLAICSHETVTVNLF